MYPNLNQLHRGNASDSNFQAQESTQPKFDRSETSSVNSLGHRVSIGTSNNIGLSLKEYFAKIDSEETEPTHVITDLRFHHQSSSFRSRLKKIEINAQKFIIKYTNNEVNRHQGSEFLYQLKIANPESGDKSLEFEKQLSVLSQILSNMSIDKKGYQAKKKLIKDIDRLLNDSKTKRIANKKLTPPNKPLPPVPLKKAVLSPTSKMMEQDVVVPEPDSKLSKLRNEFMDSERVYNEKLHIFLDCLSNESGKVRRECFEEIEILRQLTNESDRFQIQLESSLRKQPDESIDTKGIMELFKNCESYTSNVVTFSRIYKTLEEKLTTHGLINEVPRKDSNKDSYNSLNINPIQRNMRYSMLLEEMEKRLPTGTDSAKRHISDAKTSAKKMADRVNIAQTSVELDSLNEALKGLQKGKSLILKGEKFRTKKRILSKGRVSRKAAEKALSLLQEAEKKNIKIEKIKVSLNLLNQNKSFKRLLKKNADFSKRYDLFSTLVLNKDED